MKLPQPPVLVFVYGTLRHAGSNHALVERWATPDLRNAHAPSLALYQPQHGAFPYAVESTTGRGVQGDLISIPPAQWQAARQRLDHLEGYNPHNMATSHYVRIRTTVQIHDTTHTAWAYVAGPSYTAQVTTAMRHLPAGIWPPASPRRGALLITPDTHTAMTRLGDDPHHDIEALLGGPAEAPTQLAHQLLMWSPRDAARTHQPNPLACLLPLADGGTVLTFGPALVTGRDRHHTPTNLTLNQATRLIDQCLHLATQEQALNAMEDACTIRRSWIS